jgi:hypothetical protein
MPRKTYVDIVVHAYRVDLYAVERLTIGCAGVAEMFTDIISIHTPLPCFVKGFDLRKSLGGGLGELLARYKIHINHIRANTDIWKYVRSTGLYNGGIIRTIEYDHLAGPIFVNLKMAGAQILDFQVTTERYDSMFDSFVENGPEIDGFLRWLGEHRTSKIDEMVNLLSTNSTIQPSTPSKRSTIYSLPGMPSMPRPSGQGNHPRPSSGQRGGNNPSPWVSTGRRATLKDGSRRTVFRNDRGEERVRRRRNRKQVYVRFEEAATPRG